eukprot:TRINITY_DN86404_c0_g1_i1.p1 TRINITY_DN86404_c0_g1~~TRINITY_DN86404_c0_g1_i1.p1  ORF type:complete len:179 (-),score=23.54 TRINITY_DN86404_c0_g1_i1:83-619(-)
MYQSLIQLWSMAMDWKLDVLLSSLPFLSYFTGAREIPASSPCEAERSDRLSQWRSRDSDCCSICLEEVANASRSGRALPCGHVFHHACIARWFQQSVACPYRCSWPVSADFDSQADVQISQDARAFVLSRRRRRDAAAACQRCFGSHQNGHHKEGRVRSFRARAAEACAALARSICVL